MNQSFIAGLAQVAPAYLNLEGSLQIAEKWIAKAGKQGVKLLAFPETWLPGYPFWLDVSAEMGLWDHPPTKEVFRLLFDNSVTIPSAAVNRLGEAAASAGLSLVMGINERAGGTLYNTLLYFGPDGSLLGKHRKLIPTYTERMVWGRGDGSTLTVVDTPMGRVGGLVCWEHWMPLARQAMHEKGELVHVAAWPTIREMHLIASRSYAFEGRCFVLAAGTVLARGNLPKGLALLDALKGDGPWMAGGSAIIGPDGKLLAGPAGADETLLTARIEPHRQIEERMALDVCGHYARPDVFTLHIYEPPQGRRD